MEFKAAASVAGVFAAVPKGFILHGSRSGSQTNSTQQEYVGTSNYARTTPYAFHATVGDDIVAIHMTAKQWGWNARGCSSKYIGVEFAQPVEARTISAAQVRAFCWVVQWARDIWPTIPLNLPTHAELDGTADYGGAYDGKTDVYSRGSPRVDELRGAIYRRLAELGV